MAMAFEELLAGDVDLSPLAVLGKLPGQTSLEEGLATVARRLAERVMKEVPAACWKNPIPI